MPSYRRNFTPGGTYLFTLVTHGRRPILTSDRARNNLRRAISDVKSRRPFDLIALVLLPDHLHAVWTLPPGDANDSVRWSRIKEGFTRLFLDAHDVRVPVSPSRSRHRERAVWQRRFWEHTCRDEDDLEGCVDYIHWNPVKHGLATSVEEYPWSSFPRFVREGEYESGWGGGGGFPGSIGAGWD